MDAAMVTTPYWWEAAPPEAGLGAEALVDSDVVIVGSGYTGLNAAITLAEAGVSPVTVIDSQRLGEGASTRNGGQLTWWSKVDMATLNRKFGAEVAQEIAGDFRDSMPFFLKRAGTLRPDFHLQLSGVVTGAHSLGDFRRLSAEWQSLPPALREQSWLLPRERLHEELKTSLYHGALVRGDGGLIHPGLYHRALRDRARELGVRLHSGIVVRRVERDQKGFIVHFGQSGTIRARQVIMGPNGYAGPLNSWLRRRLIPVKSYIIATDELPAEQLRELIPNGRGVGDTKRILYYYRLSPDGRRILFGGRASFTSTDELRSAVGLRRFMASVFPSLKDVGITHSWLGNVAFSFDFLPHLGVHDGIHYAGGCNGSGVVMTTYLGDRVARMVLNGGGERTGLARIRFPTVPFYTGHPWFLGIIGNIYRLQDKMTR